MEEMICNEINRFVRESPLNCFPDSDEPYFDEPLVGFTAAGDQLFADFKTIIGDFHQTPQEVMEGALGVDKRAATVISWILPIMKPTRESNRSEKQYPSRAWALTRNNGEQFNTALRHHLVTWLETQGRNAVAPLLVPSWKQYSDTPVGIASAWSERHAAYAAGLGTFSLNDALITPKGIAHRCGSVITDLPLAPSARPYPDHRYNCLYYRDGSCGLCIARCPAGALSRDGHDKNRCSHYCHTVIAETVTARFGTIQAGCGLCQTKVPCEGQIPGNYRSAS